MWIRETVAVKGGFVLLKFPYSESAVAEIKQYPGATWVPTMTGWRVPYELYTLLAEQGVIHGNLSVVALPKLSAAALFGQANLFMLPSDLMKHQKDGIPTWHNMLLNYGGALNCDEMGLGKTREAIEVAKLLAAKRVVVLCPSIAKGVWRREVEQWHSTVNVCYVDGLTPTALEVTGEWVICNYDIVAPRTVSKRKAGGVVQEGEKRYDTSEFAGWGDTLADWQPDLVILDEFRHLKGKGAKKRKAIKKVCMAAKYRLGLDGTPISENTKDLWSPLDLILPGRFGQTDFQFRVRYAGAYHNGYGYTDPNDPDKELDADGLEALARNREELRTRLNTYMVRRLARDVMKDLPPLRPIVVPVDVGQDTKVTKSTKGLATQIRAGADAIQSAAAMVAVQAALSKAKLSATVEQTCEILDQKSHVIVFCHFRESRVALMEQTRKAGKLAWGFDGSVPHATREEQLQGWRKQGGALVMTIDTGGQALTLTEAHAEIVHDMEWSATKIVQALRRAVRKGLKHHVDIYLMCAKGTLDDYLRKTCIAKINSENAVVGAAEPGIADALREEKETKSAFLSRIFAVSDEDVANVDQWMLDAAEDEEGD